MFSKKTYRERRKALKEKVSTGLILFFGNEDSPMNYTDNTYHFRQDSTFLYYFGIQRPGLIALLDIDNDREILFGDDYTVEDWVWMGPQPTVKYLAENCDVGQVQPLNELGPYFTRAKNSKQTIHFLPLYRPENKIKLQALTGIVPDEIAAKCSLDLVRAIIQQREFKTEEEIDQISRAVTITSALISPVAGSVSVRSCSWPRPSRRSGFSRKSHRASAVPSPEPCTRQ